MNEIQTKPFFLISQKHKPIYTTRCFSAFPKVTPLSYRSGGSFSLEDFAIWGWEDSVSFHHKDFSHKQNTTLRGGKERSLSDSPVCFYEKVRYLGLSALFVHQ